METVLLQINNDKAYRLINDLEAQHLVTVLKKEDKPNRKLSEKYAGSLHLTDEEYQEMQTLIVKSRNDCERFNIDNY